MGTYYWGGEMYYGGVKRKNDSLSKVSSLTINGVERRDDWSTLTAYMGYSGGDFIFRNVKAGDYVLQANERNFWYATYYGTAYTDYGVEYYDKAVMNSTGPVLIEVKDGTIISKLGPSLGQSWVDSDFYTHEETEGPFIQDILYGEFRSKTVGGYQ